MSNYNRSKAVEYASIWWNKRNPNFFNFDKLGGDCTNFISQCLFYGGNEMNFSKNGWFYSSLNSRSPAWTGVEEFYSFLITNNSKKGAKGRLVTMDELEVGDVVQLNQKGIRYNHNLLVTSVGDFRSPKNILVACHTNDAFNKRLSDYSYKSVRFIKIL